MNIANRNIKKLKGAIDYNGSKVTKDFANPETGYFTYEETLVTGENFITAVSGGKNIVDTSVKKIIFGRPFEYEAEIARLSSTETAVDLNGSGTINLYKDETNGIIYIISPYRIMANANSPESTNLSAHSDETNALFIIVSRRR